MDILTSTLPALSLTQEASTKKSTGSNSKKTFGRWTKEEHQRFIEGLKLFGKNWKKVEEYVSTRNGAQIRSHAQKFFNRLDKELTKKDGGNNDSLGSEFVDNFDEEESLQENSEVKEQRSRSNSTNISAAINGTGIFEKNDLIKNKDDENKIEIEGEIKKKDFLEEKTEPNDFKKILLSQELNLLFSEENVQRIQNIINILNETYFAPREKDGDDSSLYKNLTFFNSMSLNLDNNELLNQKQRRFSMETPILLGETLKIEGNQDKILCLKRKTSLDESLLQKKIKRE